MIISKIEKQKKDRKRYNIYLEGEFFCGLYEDTILKYGLAAGDGVSEAELNDIREFDEYLYGKKAAMDYLSYRIRTNAEIRKKLRSKKLSESAIERVIGHLVDLGLLNDEEFAKQLITEKIKRKPIGRRLLKQKLFEKGVPAVTGELVMERIFSEINEKDLALWNFTKYYKKVKDLEISERKSKVFDYLARKGFDFDIVNEVIRENIY
jgi:regulatory protein